MIETAPGRLSAAAFAAALRRQDGSLRHPKISSSTAFTSPLASDCTSDVIADCSALFALNTLASRALITRNRRITTTIPRMYTRRTARS